MFNVHYSSDRATLCTSFNLLVQKSETMGQIHPFIETKTFCGHRYLCSYRMAWGDPGFTSHLRGCWW